MHTNQLGNGFMNPCTHKPTQEIYIHIMGQKIILSNSGESRAQKIVSVWKKKKKRRRRSCQLSRLHNILSWGLVLHLWDTCCCLPFCLTGARRAPEFAVKDAKSVFGRGGWEGGGGEWGGFSPALHQGLVGPWTLVWFSLFWAYKSFPNEMIVSRISPRVSELWRLHWEGPCSRGRWRQVRQWGLPSMSAWPSPSSGSSSLSLHCRLCSCQTTWITRRNEVFAPPSPPSTPPLLLLDRWLIECGHGCQNFKGFRGGGVGGLCWEG